MSEGFKLVEFHKFCKKCKNRSVLETLEPCNECLSEGGRLYSKRPLHFEKGGGSNGRRTKRSQPQELTRNKKQG